MLVGETVREAIGEASVNGALVVGGTVGSRIIVEGVTVVIAGLGSCVSMARGETVGISVSRLMGETVGPPMEGTVIGMSVSRATGENVCCKSDGTGTALEPGTLFSVVGGSVVSGFGRGVGSFLEVALELFSLFLLLSFFFLMLFLGTLFFLLFFHIDPPSP